MRNYILSILLLIGLFTGNLWAQNSVTVTNYVTVTITNTVVASSTNDLTSTNSDSAEFGKYDITFSSAGSRYGGHTLQGVDFSVSTDPFEKLPDLWVGVSQSLYWTPKFGGSTDLDADWNFHVVGNLYTQIGWSAGDVYGAGIQNVFRTGPEFIGQYYMSTDTYLYAALNYDLLTKQSGSAWTLSNRDNNGWRWSLGIGVEF